MFRKLVATFALLTLVTFAPIQASVAEAATAKIGGTCKTIGAKKTIKKVKAVCAKKGKKKVWVKVVAKPALGSISRPAPIGSEIKVGDFQVALQLVNNSVDAYICAENMFNDGCTIDSNFHGVPDPTSDKRWVELVFSATNKGANAVAFDPTDVGAVVNGTVVWQGIFQPVASNRIKDLTVLPGGTATGSVYIQLAKNTATSLFVLKNGYFTTALYFFQG